MFYIYNKETSRIESNPTRGKHYLKAQYKTMGAAKAAMTRMHKKFETERFELMASKYSFERDRDEAKAENSPLYICGIAEADYYHDKIEKTVTKTGICPGTGKQITHTASVNESHYMSPLSESYWSI
jgi:hypothetical protein